MKTAAWRLALLALVSVVLSGCGGTGSGQDPDPLVEDFGIAFVMRPLAFDAGGALVQQDIRTAEGFTPGGDLFYRDLASPSAPTHNVTGTITGGLGDVKDVEVSYDGTRLIFSLRLPDIPNATRDEQNKWDIWEYDIPTDRLRRVTTANSSMAGDDIAPHYLPDGRIVFSSNRQRQFRATLTDEGKGTGPFYAMDENRAEHAMMLHVMEAGDFGPPGLPDTPGGNIQQISMNVSHDLDPVVRADPSHSGRIMFSRWDNMGGREQISLYEMNPDGTELQLLYGAHSHATGTNNSTIQFLQPREMEDGRIMTVMLPFTGTNLGGDLTLIDTSNYIDNTFPTAANTGVLSGPAQEPATGMEVHTDNSISPGGRFMSAWPLNDGTSRALVSWSACRVVENGLIVPCTPARLADPAAVEADPIYGVYIYDMDNNTQIPIVVPQEGFAYSDVVAVSPHQVPTIIFDKVPGVDLDSEAAAMNAGILNIRSVYDVDGVDTAVPDIATLADPALTTAADRPARFLRIVKSVGMPDNDTKQIPGTAFGASAQQLMREIVGYAPVQPDGSVRTYVPANVPLAISVVDGTGRRLSSRHQNWLQLRPGEEVRCNGCHDHTSGTPHGHPEAPISAYAGAPANGQFPNTNNANMLFSNPGESMAETITRVIPDTLLPSADLHYVDYWTDPTVRTPDASTTLAYAALTTPAPQSAACQTGSPPAWTSLCRAMIHYETHIHPLWSVTRGVAGADTCINCHARADNMGAAMVPAGQLDLTDGVDPNVPEHFKAYRELLFQDNAEELDGMGGLQDIMQPTGPIDPVTGLPTPEPIIVNPPMSPAGALASTAFFAPFAAGGTHDGYLTPEELRLLAEWLDIGAQYYNDPSVVP